MDASGVEIQTCQFGQYARLIVLDGECAHREFYFLSELSVGRGPENAVRIRHGSVSDRHATIQEKNGDYVLTDLGSTNGTWINQQRIKERVLSHGERIKLGQCEVVFLCFRGHNRSPEAVAVATGQPAAEVIEHSNFSQSQVVQTPQQQRGPATMLRGGDPVFELMSRILAMLEFAPRAQGPEAACGEILDKILELLGERAVILQLERGVTVVRAARRSGGEVGQVIQVPRDVVQRVLGERKGVLCYPSSDEARPAPRSGSTVEWIRSLVAVPIIGADYLVGVLYVDSLSDANALDKECLQALLLVGRALGVLLRELDHVHSLTEQGDARAMARRFLPASRTTSEVLNTSILPKKPVHVEAVVLRAAMAPVGTDAVEPESMVHLQDAFISRVQAVVCQNGGMLEWVGGPGVKAIFGFPQGKPDLSAVKAALALQRETYALTLKARLTMGLEVGTRISMELGDLVVGMGGTGCQLHLVSAGAAADVAGRLTGFAEPGEILVGPAMLARFGPELRQGRTVEMRGAATSGTSVLGLQSERGPKRIEPTRAVEVQPARVRHFRSELVGEGVLVSSVQTPEVFLVQLPQTDRTNVLIGGELIHVELGGALFGPEVSFLATVLASDVADPSEDGTVTLRIQIIVPHMLDMA